MKRWTNSLPGATKRLGAMMAFEVFLLVSLDARGYPWWSGAKNCSTTRPNTLLQLSRSSILEAHLAPRGRAIHLGTTRTLRNVRYLSAIRYYADLGPKFLEG